MFQVYVPNVLSVPDECCKCFIWKVDLDVPYTCMFQAYISSVFRCFIRRFASVSSGCCICLQWFSNVFSGIFVSVSHVCYKCFICLLLYVATVASGCFKSRSDIAHGMRVGSGRRRGRRPRRHGRRARRRGTTTGALPREPDALGARSLPVWSGRFRVLASPFFI